MTYGLGPAGYDIRVRERYVLYPGYFVIASAIEEFCMPDDIQAVVHDKSTWARRGLSVFNTIIDPGFVGSLTLEIKDQRHEGWFPRLSRPIVLEPGDPIAQVVFSRLDAPTDQPYAGRYQHQGAGPQAARRLVKAEADGCYGSFL